jgi:hypothetical protein
MLSRKRMWFIRTGERSYNVAKRVGVKVSREDWRPTAESVYKIGYRKCAICSHRVL